MPPLAPFIVAFLFVTSSFRPSHWAFRLVLFKVTFFLLLSSVCLYMSSSSLTFHSCAASVKPVISPVLTPDLFWCSRLRLRPSPHPLCKVLQTMCCNSGVEQGTIFMLWSQFSFSLCQCCTFVKWHNVFSSFCLFLPPCRSEVEALTWISTFSCC